MQKASALKVAQIWGLKTSKNLPKSVERYVQEGKDQGMDEGKAWAVAWSRYCKYKQPGSPHCQMETSEYFPGKSKKSGAVRAPRGWEPPEEGECPAAVVAENLAKFLKSIEPTLGDTRKALKVLGHKVLREEDSIETFEENGEVLYFFELDQKGKDTFTLRFSGDFYEDSFEKNIQRDVDEFTSWSEEVMCPPRKFTTLHALNHASGKQVLLRGRVTPDTLKDALEEVGLS